ncbi:hypothetical protein [Salinarimonas soli]|uniref:Uncharacterized protein n=1 Tax=Salinarimonas soli TaxID=1638099 RepID=A0A5B2VEI0_9HYPH|nr:hypothetical protein [Salinarimonas soli]KAA2237008.1 hypothetical protein F0L46_12100 [Salinarimonas soli]
MPSIARADRSARISAARVAGPRRSGRRKAAPAQSRNALLADFLAVCELDPAVELVRPAAGPVIFPVGDEEIEHLPDFELVRDGEAFLVDVVADADLIHHPLGPALIGGAVALDGRALHVETGSSLAAEPRRTTVRLVAACRHVTVSAGDRVRILHHLDECGVAPLVEVAGAAHNALDGVAAVLALAVEGLVSLDIDRPIVPETPVRRRKSPPAVS